VLITGCSSGIGKALCEEFKNVGCDVWATARKAEVVEQLKNEGFHAVQLDVMNQESITEAVKTVVRTSGRIDILVNNAGINTPGPVIEVDMKDSRAMFETNVLGLLAVAQVVARQMITQKSGKIINIGSVVGGIAIPFGGVYSATKAAVSFLTDSLRIELAPFGVQVMLVCPGAIRSSIADTGAKEVEKYKTGSNYSYIYTDGILKRAYISQQGSTDTHVFAAGVVQQALKRSLRRQYWAGVKSTLMWFARFLPYWITDPVVSRTFALSKLAAYLGSKK